MENEPRKEPEITMQDVTSSQIEAVGYDNATRTLAIRFKGGALYHYDGCEPETFEAFRGAESVGSYFYKHIKPNADKYPYRKIVARRPEAAASC